VKPESQKIGKTESQKVESLLLACCKMIDPVAVFKFGIEKTGHPKMSWTRLPNSIMRDFVRVMASALTPS
jgi:hypothetical protein